MENAESDEINRNILVTRQCSHSAENKNSIDSLGNINIDQIRLTTISGTTAPGSKETLREYENFVDTTINNNHHVVPIGVLIVLVTIYLGMNGIQKCFVTCSVNQTPDGLQRKSEFEEHNIYSKNMKRSHILERLLEYKDICKDLEVFTKDINIDNYTHDDDGNVGGNDGKDKGILSSASGGGVASGGGSGSGSGSGDCAKPYSKKHKKTKHLIKLSTNGKNGFHKHNKSTKAKNLKTDKKDISSNKKSSPAEPIIYLFALVFVYLLLKAASDINQHYKSQNKNDKRLRRCSLQSYAQTHRPDRRASKASELALKPKQQRILAGSTRSIFIEQPQQQPLQHIHYHRYLECSPNRTTPPTPPTQPSLRIRTAAPNNWQLLRQHMTQSVDNSDISTCHTSKSDAAFPTQEFTAIRNRRCSVPVALNYQQRQKIPSSLPLGIIHSNDPIPNRRTSISMPLDHIDGLATTEIKRRVRMINRH